MGEVVSKAEFARRLDVEPAAVSAWISREKLTSPALTEDGRIDFEMARQQLRDRLDPRRSSTEIDGAGARNVEPSLIEQQRRQQIEEGEIRLARLREEALERRGILMRTADVRAERGRAYAELVQAMDRWIDRLGAELGLTSEQLAAARRAWREFRAAEADAIVIGAEAAPELVP